MKKKYIETIIELNEPCYLCTEIIKLLNEKVYCIGKNKEGKQLYRHRKCLPIGKITIKKKEK